MKILRRLMWVVSVALVLSGLTLHLIHTRPVRHFALTRIQAYFRENQGLELQVGDFDYNLLSSKLEFKEVALNGLPSQAQPASSQGKTCCGDDSGLADGSRIVRQRADLDRWFGRKLDEFREPRYQLACDAPSKRREYVPLADHLSSKL